jgi:hypothetical protein
VKQKRTESAQIFADIFLTGGKKIKISAEVSGL